MPPVTPQSLPPICRLPGTKRLLWRLEDVERWLAEHVAADPETRPVLPAVEKKARRGRPTKAEQVARNRLVASSNASTDRG